MILTSLIDNTRLNHRTDLAIERGLSIHINTMGKSILFDAGSSDAFCDNAELLNVNIDQEMPPLFHIVTMITAMVLLTF